VQRDVGVAYHVHGGLAGPADRDALARADDQVLPGHGERVVERRRDALRDLHRVRAVGAGDGDHGELVTAETGQHVPDAQRAPQPPGDPAQQLVACRVAEAVVDHLEVVDVEQEKRGSLPWTVLGEDEGCGEPVLEEQAVGQAGERVVRRVAVDLFLRSTGGRHVERRSGEPARAPVAVVRPRCLDAQPPHRRVAPDDAHLRLDPLVRRAQRLEEPGEPGAVLRMHRADERRRRRDGQAAVDVQQPEQLVGPRLLLGARLP
jgi:hypothetical protein